MTLRTQRAFDAATFEDLRALTFGLLANEGLAPPFLATGFVDFWLSRHKTPAEIVHIALGSTPVSGGNDAMVPSTFGTSVPVTSDTQRMPHEFAPDQPRELTYESDVPVRERVNEALAAAVMALANLDRAIRNQPAVTSAAELHPNTIATFLRAARETTLAQHPRVVLQAVNVASTELREIIDRLITDPEAAIVNDAERMTDACQGMTRLVIEKYRKSIYDAFADVRAEQAGG